MDSMFRGREIKKEKERERKRKRERERRGMRKKYAEYKKYSEGGGGAYNMSGGTGTYYIEGNSREQGNAISEIEIVDHEVMLAP